MYRYRQATAFALVMLLVAGSTPAIAQTSVYLEELTWTEARDAIKAGKTTVILPTGGTEQKGPHMVLGEHTFVNHYNAGEIARRLGTALVAPTLGYAPEGAVDPPSGAMRYAGTISLPEETFVQVLLWAGRSFKVHGFTDVVFISDNGGNQAGLKAAAEQLNKEWSGGGTRAHYIPEYNAAAQSPNSPFDLWLIERGETRENIGRHAGIKDTGLAMAVEAMYLTRGRLVRWDKLAPNGGFEDSGVNGNPTRATVEYGKRGREFQIDAAVSQIKARVGRKSH